MRGMESLVWFQCVFRPGRLVPWLGRRFPVDPFLLLLLFVSFRLFSLLLYFFALPFVCSLWWVAEVGFIWPMG